MIPSLVVDEVRDALKEFLSSTFALNDDDAREELARFLTDPDDGIFRGPYLHVRTPFQSVGDDWRSPVEWRPSWMERPYRHQATAFERLTTARGHTPEPTLVTTGTGSGKTEAFLVPILDHCIRMRAAGQDGIKALILYPMNALASDQAGRIAKLIDSEPELDGIRVGMYVGENGRNTAMGADAVIDKREALRANPPDILLTNYKMLDFLLLRSEDKDLWAVNSANTLRYLVLDEFHTYDGAQGTDVAMLLRRLGATLGMARLGAPLGDATPVATSATMGSTLAAQEELRDFAGKVFGTEFDRNSVIGETRLTPAEACETLDFRLPVPRLDAIAETTDQDELAALFCTDVEEEPFQGGVVELGDKLLQHTLTHGVVEAANNPRPVIDIVRDVVIRDADWGRVYQNEPERVEQALTRFLQLLSVARRRTADDRITPLFPIEVQLWVREVSRLLRTVSTRPGYRWRDSAAREQGVGRPGRASGHAETEDTEEADEIQRELPAVYCRRCGAAGWATLLSEATGMASLEPGEIYSASINRSPLLRTMMAAHPDDPSAVWFDTEHLAIVDEQPVYGVAVHATQTEEEARREVCPTCGDTSAIAFLGRAVASLASVAINTLFASEYLDDNERKLLAFTDSVQDASHRASFFGGRTHRINLRTLMSTIVREEGEVSLDSLGDQLFATAETPRAKFGLVPPDLTKDRYVATTWTDDVDPYGTELLGLRTGFEVDLEYGLRSRVGRTLELSQASAAAVRLGQPDDVDAIAGLVGEDIEGLTGARPDPLAVVVYIRGLAERLRLKGGIHHPLLDEFVNSGGEQWFIWGGRPDGLPPFTPDQSRPKFFTTEQRPKDLDSITSLTTTPTWVIDWAMRTLAVPAQHGRDINERTLRILARETEAIRETTTRKGTIYGLERSAIVVRDLADGEVEATMVRCGLCGQLHATSTVDHEEWLGTPCLRYRCTGRFEDADSRHQQYYRRLYRRGVTRRVVTGEHTGLLDRHRREDLERAFKTGDAPDAPNVLTATPTLEMGIDIGDLSAVMLTSVPRNPASYIQRVGRAGRLTGNALITSFVRSDSHGLYYLAQPEAMLAGDVRPPNCFLDAAETLHRQYVAFLIDRCADGSIEAPPLPTQAGRLFGDRGPLLADGSFLAAVAAASQESENWVDRFLQGFEGHLAETTVARAREFASSGIRDELERAITDFRSDVKDLQNRIRQLNQVIEPLEAEEAQGQLRGEREDELKDLRGQQSQLRRLLAQARDEYSLSSLERFGVLPNYNLVDDSVRLVASTWSSDTNGEFHTDVAEFDRSARLAITELAPGNSFYAGGHRHRIDAVKIGPAEAPLVEEWRICPDCSYVQLPDDAVGDGPQTPTTCARCHSAGFADTGAVHRLLRVGEVYAAASEEAARVYDETDDRDREQYTTTTLIDVEPESITGAWRLEGKIFGAELGERTHIRTLNLGIEKRPGERAMIGGDELTVSGFGVCRYCGAVEEARSRWAESRPERLHQGWCRVRRGTASADPIRLSMFHQLTTEAIRFVLPISLLEVTEQLASFKAALLLGLREDFGGDPDHIGIDLSSAPNREGQGRRRFMVVYDRVPGGTGYLARLGDPVRVQAILEKAQRVIGNCECIDEGRQACHRCLLGVSDRRDYDTVSRALALRLLDDLLNEWKAESVETVSNLDIGQVEESELERRFRVGIRAYSDAYPDRLSIAGQVHGGAYEMSVTAEDGTVARYRVEEQEGIGQTRQVLPDFVISRVDQRGQDIAVFCDGFAYHASARNNIIAEDAEKRRRIRADGHLVWNLSWEDVAEFHDAVTSLPVHPIPQRALMIGPPAHAARTVHQSADHGPGLIEELDRNPMELLIEYLRSPDEFRWRGLAQSVVTGLTQSGQLGQLDARQIEPVISTALRAEPIEVGLPEGPPVVLAGRHVTDNGLPLVTLLDIRPGMAQMNRWTVIASLNDDQALVEHETSHRRRWREWLQWANILQFLDAPGQDVLITGRSAADVMHLDELAIVAGAVHTEQELATLPDQEPSSASGLVSISTEMEEELDLLLDERVAAIVRAALEQGAPATFRSGVEPPELAGVQLEAAWEDLKVSVVPDDLVVADTPTGWVIRRVSDWTLPDLLATLEERA